MPRRPPSKEALNKRSPTSYDVALRAGVSQSAVSRAFKAGGSVAPATRARILKAAKELGFAPNAIAQGLITRRSNLVAVLISTLTNIYYPEVLAELTERLSERGVRVLLFTLQNESAVEATLSEVWRYRVDAVISAARLEPAAVQQLAARGVPLVLYNRHIEDAPVSSVCCDNFAGEQMLVELLAAAGHKRFGLIAGPDDNAVSQERIGGALDRLRSLGLEHHLVRGGYNYESGRKGLLSIIEEMGRPDAVVAANDGMAIGALDAARFDAKLRVPDDISIVGFDGYGPAAWASYDLTTVVQPVKRMAESAVSMVMERIETPDLSPERRLFAGEIRTGRSARISPRG